jgi:ribonuclease PH
MNRLDDRQPDQLRTVTFELGIAEYATGSALVSMGKTRVLCGVTIEEAVPRWMKEQRVPGGWLTAEYAMLPYSTLTRKMRDIARGKLDGRSSEIQRLIGRAMRAVVDLDKLGPRTLWVDCDVLQADGGTRTAAINGASVAVSIACGRLIEEKKLTESPLKGLIAAVSAGVINGVPLLDLNYEEDKEASVDLNLVGTEEGALVEVQGAGEEATFSQAELSEMLSLGVKGVGELIAAQRAALASLALLSG